MKAKEIEDYISIMRHTLTRRMNNQEGKEYLVEKYCYDMEMGLLALAEQEKKDELLGLYREKDNHIENWENYDRSCDMGYIAKFEYLQEQIKALEEEIK